MNKLREYTGLVHLHSTCSDGTWQPGWLVGEALRGGLDFVFLTDHDNIKAREIGWHGWFEPGGLDGTHPVGRRMTHPPEVDSPIPRLLMCVGAEVTPKDSHYLALGTESLPSPFLPSQKIIDHVRRSGGVGVIAHPDHRGNRRFGIGSYGWRDWSVSGYDLVDLWDLMTGWQDALHGLPSAYLAYHFPARMLRGPKRETLRRWDEQLQARPAPVIGCCDNHGRLYRLLRDFYLLPYPVAMRILRLHVLCEPIEGKPAEVAERILLDAMVAGRSFIANDFWQSSKGFRFSAISDSGETARMGDTVSPGDGPWRLRVTLPAEGRITLLRNGEPWRVVVGRKLEEQISSGIFRVEVEQRLPRLVGRGLSREYRPWLYSNAIRIVAG